MKSRLDTDRLREAIDNIAVAKRLRKSRANVLGPQQYVTMGCLFAFESALTLDTVCQNYVRALAGTMFGQHIDLIIVLDRGIVTLVANGPVMSTWSTMMAPEGTGGAVSEGFHVGVAAQEFGDRSLDAFLRILLAHLALFRHRIDHPGFDWASLGAPQHMVVHYLLSMTAEPDPDRREAKLREYRQDFERRFSR